MSDQILDVAIIGAGAAGTYTAWRLANDPKYKTQRISVFDFLKIEGKAHVGGRLWSKHLPGLGYTRKAELGGMRFLTTQPIVTNLINHLGMKTVPFVVNSNHNLFDLRASVFRYNEVRDPELLPYNLGPMEKGKSPSELLLYAAETILPQAPYLTPEEWTERKRTFKFDGIHLYKLGFWNLLERILTTEGYQYATNGQGYDTFLSNWNAADALEFLYADFGPNVSYRYLHAGYQELPVRLLDDAKKKGVQFEENHRLRSWSKVANSKEDIIELLFDDPTQKDEEPIRVLTRKLILAMPRKSLELINMPDDADTEHFRRDLLPAVQPQPMFKFFVGYEYPWWRVLGMTSGQTITDNPLRQVYYWGSNYQRFFAEAPPETGGVENDPEHSMIMVYLDGRDVPYWQPLFESISRNFNVINPDPDTEFEVLKVSYSRAAKMTKGKRSLLSVDGKNKNFFLGAVGERNTAMADALENLEETITTLLRQTHGLNYVPRPYTFAFADWTADPFGGAYNLWNPGYKSWEVTEEIIKPFKGSSVYIVGEAYSTKQGWVEGALETSEQMLETYFGLKRPDWLPETDTNSKSYHIESR